MSGRGILDADMHMLWRSLLQGWRWWCGEIGGLIPPRWRSGGGERLPSLLFAEARLVSATPAGHRDDRMLRPGVRANVLLPEAICLTRIVDRPQLGAHDLQQMLMLEGETLLPFPAGTMIVAGRAIGTATTAGRMRIEVAGLPIERAREVAVAIADAGIVAVRIVLQGIDRRGIGLDFAPAMRKAGLIATPRGAAPLAWVLVAFLVALNLAMLIWHDAARVDRLDRLVEEQAPAVAVAQKITRRITVDRTLVQHSLELRRQHDALGGLAVVSAALPAGAWLQRYVWDGATVRLAGYKPTKVDVAGALRRSGRFAELRSMNDETQAEVPAGAPFDLSGKIESR